MRSLHTPQQETNSAYNPGVSFQGGQFIAQGISQAGDAISAGLAQFAKNREERDYMDERMKSVAANLAKYRDFEKSASEDDTSPAGTLLKTFSNWDNKPLAAKKAALVDADHLITKSERNLDQARAEQYQMLAVQDRQAQFAAQQKQNQIAEERNWKNDALDALYRHQAAMRNIDADRRAEGEFDLRKQIYADTRARYAAGEKDAETQRGAVGGLLRDFNQFAEGPQFNGTGMQRPMSQFEAYRRAAGANPRAFTPQMMDDLGRMAVSEDRLSQSALRSFSPTLGTKSVTLADGRVIEIPFGTTSAGGVDWMPQTLTQTGGKAPVPTVSITTTDADGNKKTRKLTAAEDAALPPTVPADIQKQMADLRKAIAADEGEMGGGDERLWYGGSRAERIKENTAKLGALQRNYGGAKAAAPAAAPPTSAVEHLRTNPGLREAFDAKYGSGAAARALGR